MALPGTLPEERVDAEPLGQVLVRGLRLSARLALMDSVRERPREEFAAYLLAVCVLTDAGTPLATADEWDSFGGAHSQVALQLFAVAHRLCGFDRDVQKKT